MNEPVLSSAATAAGPAKKAHIIVLGNEKGGSGKTTTCMHLIVSLLRLGFTVGSIDIDSRQRSLSRYLENRRQTMLKENTPLPQPQHIVIQKSPFNIVQEAEEDERDRFGKALARLTSANDFVVIDGPGSDTFLSRFAHASADTIITPINDSFVDLDVLATVDGQTMKIVKPSIYSEMVWEQKLQRAKRDGGSIEWIVMRNRLSNIDAKNKRFMTQVTGELSRRIGFRIAPGFSERVIFREMFLQGLTVLDIMDMSGNANLSMSHIAARQEVRDLLRTLHIATLDERINKARADEEKAKEEKTEKTEKAEKVEIAEKKVESEEKKEEKETKAPVLAKPEDAVVPVPTVPVLQPVKAESELASVSTTASVLDKLFPQPQPKTEKPTEKVEIKTEEKRAAAAMPESAAVEKKKEALAEMAS